MVDAFEINIIDSGEPQKIGVPEFLNDDDYDDDLVLDKGEDSIKKKVCHL